MENYFNYFTEIEDHFRAQRGTGLFMLSPIDWALIERWKNAGIPLEAVLRGISAVFGKWRARPLRDRRPINLLAYCAEAVIEEAQSMAESSTGARKNVKPPFEIDAVRAFVTRNAIVLREKGWADIAELLEALDLDALYQDLEQLEQRLTAIEEKLIAALRAAATEEALAEARRALDADLKPYHGKMSVDQVAMLEKQFLERRLLEAAGLPRLSLFYL